MKNFPEFENLSSEKSQNKNSLGINALGDLFPHTSQQQSSDINIQEFSSFDVLLSGANETIFLDLSQVNNLTKINRLSTILSRAGFERHLDRFQFQDQLIEGTEESERLNGGFGNDIIQGKEGDDRLNGRFGKDLIDGGEGDDRIFGGLGNDVLLGGAGSDIAFGGFGNDFFTHQFSASLEGEIDSYHGGEGNDTLVLLTTFGELTAIQSELERFDEFQQEQQSRRPRFRNSKFTFEFDASSLTVKNIEHVEVILLNQIPTANADEFTIDEDSTSIFYDVLFNDTDPDHLDVLTVTAIDATNALGSVSFSDEIVEFEPNGQFEFLAAGEETTDSFRYTVSDLAGATDTAEVTVTVTGVNDGPEIGDADLSGGVTAIANNAPGENPTVLSDSGVIAFTDVDLSDVHTVSVSPQSVDSLGTLIANVTTDSTNTGAGEVTYSFEVNDVELDSLAAGEFLEQTYTLTIDDGNSGIASTNVTIRLTGTNDQPLVQAVNAAVGEDDAQVTGLFVVSDVDLSDTHTFSITSAPEGGTVALNAARNGFIFNPGNDFQFLKEGEETVVTFDYTATDSSGTTNATSEAGTVSITVIGNNDGPTAIVDVISLTEDSAPVINNFALNDTDPDQLDVLTVSAIDTTGTQGSISLTDGSVAYDPNDQFESLAAGEETTDSFRYTVSDLAGATDTTEVTVTVMGVNDGPEIGDADLSGGVTAIADNDPGENITVLSDAGVISFTDVDLSDVHTVSVAPQSVDFLGTFIANVTTDSTNSGAGEVTYSFEVNDADLDRLAAGEFLEQTYMLTIEDGNGGIASEDVTIRLTGTNDQPLVQAVNATVGEDEAQVTGLFIVSDVDLSDTHIFSITRAPENGMITLNAAGDGFIFNPGNDFQFLQEGEEVVVTFEYTATDSSGTANAISEVGTVSITVVGNNDAPTAVVDAISLTEDSAPVVNNFALNDTDPDHLDTLTVAAIDATGTRGTVSLTDGIVQYNPNGQFEALAAGDETTDSFSYTVSDLAGATDTTDVTITVIGVNDDPEIGVADLSGEVTEIIDNALGDNTTVLGDSGVISFTDVDFTDVHTVSIIPQNSGFLGTLVANVTTDSANAESGEVTYAFEVNDVELDHLAAGEFLEQTYTLTIEDGNGGTASEDVMIRLTGTNDQPLVQAVNVTVGEDEAQVTGLFAVSDVDLSDTHTFSIINAPESGTVILNAAGDGFIFNPGNDFQFLKDGEEVIVTFEYTAMDSGGTANAISEVGAVSITVMGTNDGPTAVADVITLTEDSAPVVNNFALNDTDPDQLDILTVSAIDITGTQGSVSLTDGIVDYDPNGQFESLAAGEETTDSFRYMVSDLAGATDTTEVTVTVTGVNDRPEFGVGDFSGVTEIADNDPGENITILGDTGIISFTDVDLSDVHTVSVAPQSAGFLGTLVANVTTDSTNTGVGEVTYSFEVNDVELDRLAADEVLEQIYTLTIDDGNSGNVSEDVTIRLIGSNDQPLVQAVNATVGEDEAQVTGLFIVSDEDLSDTHTFSLTSAPEGGTVTLNATGNGFIFNPGNDFQFLNEGEEAVVTFDYIATDSSGTENATSEAGTVSITVVGTNYSSVSLSFTGLLFETQGQNIFNSGEDTTFQQVDVLGASNIGGSFSESLIPSGVEIIPAVPSVLITPEIPAVYSPAIPAVYSEPIPSVLITPEIPAVYSPAIPAVFNPFFPYNQITPAIPSALITPAIPAVYSPAIPSMLISEAIPPQLITPAIPAVYSPDIPAVTSPPLGISGALDATVGLESDLQLTGGEIDATLPFTLTLNVPAQAQAGQEITIDTGFALDSTASFLTNSPEVSLTLSSILDIEASVDLLADLNLTDLLSIDLEDTNELLNLQTNDTGFSLSGPTGETLETGVDSIELDTHGIIIDPNTLSGSTTKEFISVDIGVTTPSLGGESDISRLVRAPGKATSRLSVKLFQVLNNKALVTGNRFANKAIDVLGKFDPSISLDIPKISIPSPDGNIFEIPIPPVSLETDIELLDFQITPEFSITQTFTLDIENLAATLTLEDNSQINFNVGDSVSFDLPTGVDVNGDGFIDIDASVDLAATLNNSTSLDIGGDYSISLLDTVFGLSVGNMEVLSIDLPPHLESMSNISGANLAPLFDETFALGGFEAETFSFNIAVSPVV